MAALSLLAPASVGAGGDMAGSTEDTVWVNPVAAGSPGGAADGSGSGSLPCTWLPIPLNPIGEDMTQAIRQINGTTHRLFHQDCNEGLPIGPVWVPEVTPRDLIPGVTGLLEERLHYPTPKLEPIDAEFGWTYVQVPVDFRVEPGEWAPVEAYAEVTNPLGTVWVRATATPKRLVFDSGDPGALVATVECQGQAPIAAYVADQPGECSFLYRNASSTAANGQTFPGSMAIVWEASWVSSDPGVSGVLDVGPTVTPIAVGVAEAKALVSCTGSMPGQGGC